MQFVGDGYGGLLGYTHSLANDRKILKFENQLLKQEKNSLSQHLEECNEKIVSLEKILNTARRKQTMIGI